MKRLIAIFAILLLLTSTACAETLRHVADQAGTFTANHIQTLETRMQKIYEKYGFDTVIVTTNDSRGKSARMYAADFYDDFRSYSAYPNGLIFSFNFALGEYFGATRGKGQRIFSDLGADDLDEVLRPHLSTRNYYNAMNAYLDYVENRLARFAIIGEDGTVTLGTKVQAPSLAQSIQQSAELLPFMLIGGLVIGLFVALYMKGKLLIAKPQRSADGYAVRGSLNLHDSSDIFLYQTVTRTRIQEPKSGGGGGGRSSGGSFRSSSGNSYGGRGGKL